MKSLFNFSIISLVLITSNSTSAREIVYIENLASQLEGETLSQLLQERLGLPSRFIKVISKKSNCQKNQEAILHVCLKKDGEMEIMKRNQDILDNLRTSFLETGD